MSRNASGTYTLPSGNPVVTGTLIESSWANTTLSDLASAMTDSLSRSAQGGMTAALRLYDGTSSVPGLAWGSETTTGWYRSGAGDMRLVVTGSEVVKYLSTGVAVTGTLSVSGNTTVGGTLAITGAVTLTANPTLSAGTANGVAYLNGSKVLTSGSALTFNGTNLGIGNSNPTEKLEVVNTSGAVTARIWSSTNTSPIASLEFQRGTNATWGADAYGDYRIRNDTGALLFQYGENGTTTEQMRLTSTGLGIGTTTMTQKVNVEGSIGTRNGGHLLSTASNTNAGGLYLDSSGSKAISLRADPDNDASGTYIGFTTDGTERARIDSSGNLTVGSTTATSRANVWGANIATGAGVTASHGQLSIWSTTTYGANIGGTLALGGDGGTYQNITYATVSGRKENGSINNYDGYLAFAVSKDTSNTVVERMRIDSSGNLLVGKTVTTYSTPGIALVPNGASSFATNTVNGNLQLTAPVSQSQMAFYRQDTGALMGYIINGASNTVSYLTTSDYRLKEDIQPMTGALAKVNALKPCTYKWKVDGSASQGFIAHELQEVCPEAVSRHKDAVDDEGNPQYQGIDTSFLVATLTAAIQELKAIVDAQGAEIAALKAV